MAQWLLKSEPTAYSWDRLVFDGRTNWDGVRNAQALNNLRTMKASDQDWLDDTTDGESNDGKLLEN